MPFVVRVEQVLESNLRVYTKLLKTAEVVGHVLQDLRSGWIHGRCLSTELCVEDHREHEYPDRKKCCGLPEFKWLHLFASFSVLQNCC